MIQTATLMKHNDMRCLQVIMLIEESKEQNNGYIGLCVCVCVCVAGEWEYMNVS